jgi:hypothetical protein
MWHGGQGGKLLLDRRINLFPRGVGGGHLKIRRVRAGQPVRELEPLAHQFVVVALRFFFLRCRLGVMDLADVKLRAHVRVRRLSVFR